MDWMELVRIAEQETSNQLQALETQSHEANWKLEEMKASQQKIMEEAAKQEL